MNKKYCKNCGCEIPKKKRRYCSSCKVEMDRIRLKQYYHDNKQRINANNKKRTIRQNSQVQDPIWLKDVPDPVKQEYWVNGKEAALRMLEIGIEEYRKELRLKYNYR